MARTNTPQATPLPMKLMGLLVLAVVIAVAAARFAGLSPVEDMGKADIVASRLIRFDSDPKGVTVVDATTGATIARTAAEGFVPGVLRGLNRMRQTSNAAPDAAYRVEKLSNGQLLLVDTVSGVALDLAAYGHSNAETIAAFLPPQGDKS